MSVELPTTSQQLKRRHWAQGQAIRSGEQAADKTVGTDGLISEVHHGYGYSIRVLGAAHRPDGGPSAGGLARAGTRS